MKIIDVVSIAFANWLNNGMFANRQRMRATDISVESNVIFTEGAARKIVRIDSIQPINEDIAFVDYIRDKMFSLDPDVEVIVNMECSPVTLSPTNQKFQRGFSKAADAYMNYKEAFDSQKGIAKITGKTYNLGNGVRLRLSKEKLDALYQQYISYLELFNYTSAGGTLVQVQLFIELIGKDLNLVNTAEKDLYGLLAPFNINSVQLKNTLKAFMSEFTPMNQIHSVHGKKFQLPLLFTEKNLSAFSSYKAQGLASSQGLLYGMDVRSHYPFMPNIFATPSAQINLLCGETGSGKTYTGFEIAISALALNQYASVVDIKGREWSKLACCTKPKVITFDERHPSFVNTLRLDDMEVTAANANEMFTSAINGTVNLLTLIINLAQNEGSPSDLTLILHEAVAKTFSTNNIDPQNPSTFKNTRLLKYSDIMPILDELAYTKSYTDAQRKMIQLARSRCQAYLGENGIFYSSFTTEVTLHDVMSSQLVIYEFNKNQGVMTDSLDVIRIFMVQYLDSKKKAMLREQGKYLFCFYEELQRCAQFGDLLEYICADVTGSRSNNAVIFLLLNSLKVLGTERAKDIRSNITSYIVGNVQSVDIRALREEFDQPWIAEQLELFAEKPNDYRNCFAASIDTGAEIMQAIIKVELPDDLKEAFKTRSTGLRSGDKCVPEDYRDSQEKKEA